MLPPPIAASPHLACYYIAMRAVSQPNTAPTLAMFSNLHQKVTGVLVVGLWQVTNCSDCWAD